MSRHNVTVNRVESENNPLVCLYVHQDPCVAGVSTFIHHSPTYFLQKGARVALLQFEYKSEFDEWIELYPFWKDADVHKLNFHEDKKG